MSDTHSNKTVQVSEKRRKLLKASAAAPLVATLTSGVAQANASAFQCINDAPTGTPFISGTTGDGAVRVSATKYEKGTSVFYFVDGVMYDASGAVSNLTVTDLLNEGFTPTGGQVLVIYEPGADGLSATQLGPWPQQQIGGINQPLYQSCLTSLIATNVGDIKGNIV